MGASTRGRDRGGFTLVEIAITVAILGILVMLAITSFSGQREKYAIESETKNFYAALMEARGRAMQRSRYHFVRITSNEYKVYEDTSPGPDGDRSCDTTTDNLVIRGNVNHAISVSSAFTVSGTGDNIVFDRRGVADGIGYIMFSVSPGSSANPDYDCISVRETRLRTGKMSGGGCVEK